MSQPHVNRILHGSKPGINFKIKIQPADADTQMLCQLLDADGTGKFVGNVFHGVYDYLLGADLSRI